jgi:hypothetical protein
MNILNVSFGIFAFTPMGWAFMAFVILCEALLLTKYLARKKYNKRLYMTVLLSNTASGIVGIITTLQLNGGWWLVVWFPWVCSHEVDVRNPNELIDLIIYYFIAFILSILIELSINYLCLKKEYAIKSILKGTICTNLVTYAIGAVILTYLTL